MKFMVSRISLWDEEKPCENVVSETYNVIEVKTLKSFNEFDVKFGETEGKWLSKGVNHCINKKGYIQREFPNNRNGWFIELNSLDELLNFKNKYGDIIVTKCLANPNITEIRIN